MKRCLSILIVVCVLLTASSVKAKDYKEFLDIKTLLKDATKVYFVGDDAKKIGLNATVLTDYVRLRIKNNFTDIDFDKSGFNENEEGYISTRVWVLGDSYPVIFHILVRFKIVAVINGSMEVRKIASEEMLGSGTRDTVADTIKNEIGNLVEKLAITFYKVRGEL